MLEYTLKSVVAMDRTPMSRACIIGSGLFFCFIQAHASVTSHTGKVPGLSVWKSQELEYEINWHAHVGETRELVFYKGEMQSELRWPTPLALMLDHHITYHTDSLPIHLTYSSALYTDTGIMEDRDWDGYPNSPLIAYSSSMAIPRKNTEFNIFTDIPIFSDHPKKSVFSDVSFKALIGYRFREISWDAMGGLQVYNEKGIGHEDDDYTYFDRDSTGVSYLHKLSMPFAGIISDFKVDRIDLQLSGIFSPYATSNNKDFHQHRALIFNDRIYNANYFELGLSTRYQWTPKLQIGFNYTFNQLLKKPGSTSVNNLITSQSYTIRDASGVTSVDHTIRFGFKYSF